MNVPTPALPVALSIAGSDSGGGAGIQADLLTFAACGVWGTTALTCLTAQSPAGVSGVHAVPATFVVQQAEQVAGFFALAAVKTGMLFDAAIVEAVAAFLAARPTLPAVVDPVMVATSGAVLLQPHAIDAVKQRLLPRAALVTPNLDEVAVLLGSRPTDADEAVDGALALARTYAVPFLVKGGHLPGERLTDVLAFPDGGLRLFEDERIEGVDTHGSGCTLSSAIAAQLAKGMELEEAVAAGRSYLRSTFTGAALVGGTRWLGHLPG